MTGWLTYIWAVLIICHFMRKDAEDERPPEARVVRR